MMNERSTQTVPYTLPLGGADMCVVRYTNTDTAAPTIKHRAQMGANPVREFRFPEAKMMNSGERIGCATA
jgi:hypothetical protein